MDLSSVTKEQREVIKGLTLRIKKLHLRYEDDYYSCDNPYSFGVVIDVSAAAIALQARRRMSSYFTKAND